MAADNVQASPASGGAQFRTFSDGTNEWPAAVCCFVTGGSAGSWTLQQVNSTNGLPVAVVGTAAVTQSGSWSVTVGAALPAGTNTIGGVELVDSAGTNKASISVAGALKVDGSAVTQPVSGTFWQATQPVSGTVTANQGGSWSVSVGAALPAGSNVIGGVELVDSGGTNKASISSAGAVKVDGSAVTQPVSGTVTANAGTGTFTVQDAADGPVTPGAVATKSMLIGAQYNTSAPAPTNTQQVALQCDSSGNLKVNVAAGGGSGGTSSSFSAAFPSTGTAAGASDGTNMKPLLVDASGFLKVNVAAGSSGNAAASATGSAVPVDADYSGLNVGGNLRGQTGVNPTGSVYAAQTDLSSVGGTSVALGQAAMAASIPVAIASNQSALSVSGTVTANIGTTNGLALDTSVNGILVAQGSTTSGEKGPLVQGAVTASAPTYTTAQTSPLSLTTAGALRTDASATTQPVSGTVTANAGTGTFTTSDLADGPVTPGSVATKSVLIGGQYNTSAPAPTTGQQCALQLDGSGNLNVNVKAGSSGNAAAGTTGSAVPTSADYTGLNVSGNLRGQTGVNPTGSVYAAQTDITSVNGVTVGLGQTTMSAAFPVVIASNQSAIPASQSGTWNVGLSAGTNTIGNVVPVAGTAGGATPYHYLPSGATNQDSTVVKASAGTVYHVSGFNTNSTPVYVKLYDSSTGPTSSSTPKHTLMIPGNSNGAGFVDSIPVGLAFASGIAFRVTGGLADNDATAVSSNCVLNLGYN